MDGESLEARFKSVKQKIESAAKRSSRDPSLITLLAVSKKQPREKVSDAIEVGQKNFGENYVQELQQRITDFPNVEWHFIGNLQRNKCKLIAGRVALIHSVDRIELAEEISKICEIKNTKQNVLIQINLGNEETKGGVAPEKMEVLLKKMMDLKGINVRGVMALPPITENPEHSRPFFRQLKALAKNVSPDCELSMGTSHDYEIAIEEGATIVRVGTSLFGSRN